LFLRFAREALPPQLVRAVPQALDVGLILRHGLRSVGFLLLACLEKALGAFVLFMFWHARSTHHAAESSMRRID
jgi:hypothetical protein